MDKIETIMSESGRLEARIYQDDDPINPITEYDQPCKIIMLDEEYSHLSTASLDDYEIRQHPYVHDTYVYYTPMGIEREIDRNDLASLLEKQTGGEVLDTAINDYRESLRVIFLMTRDDIINEVSKWSRKQNDTGRYRVTEEDREQARDMMRNVRDEVRVWMNGEVYGYVIHDVEDDDLSIDSLWGMYGYSYVVEEATTTLESTAKLPPYTAAWEEPYALIENGH